MAVAYVNIGGTWVPIGGGIVDPVWVDPNPPTDPTVELWFDTDASNTVSSSVGVEAAKPSATSAVAGMHYFATDTLRDWLCDGLGWIIVSEPPQFWVPTVTNLTLGNGSWNARAMRNNGWCDFFGVLTLGSTTNITGDFRVTVPYGAAVDDVAFYRGHAFQFGVNEHTTMIANNLPNTFSLRGINTAGATAVQAVWAAAVPFTWLGATGSIVHFAGRYPLASRYS